MPYLIRIHKAAVTCSSGVYCLGGIKFGFWVTGRLGHAWVVLFLGMGTGWFRGSDTQPPPPPPKKHIYTFFFTCSFKINLVQLPSLLPRLASGTYNFSGPLWGQTNHWLHPALTPTPPVHLYHKHTVAKPKSVSPSYTKIHCSFERHTATEFLCYFMQMLINWRYDGIFTKINNTLCVISHFFKILFLSM